MDKTLQTVIIAGILLVSISIVYYFLWFLPSRETNKERARKECAKGAYIISGGKDTNDRNDRYFEECLREKGITN